MLPDRVSNPGPLTYESGALPRIEVLANGSRRFGTVHQNGSRRFESRLLVVGVLKSDVMAERDTV